MIEYRSLPLSDADVIGMRFSGLAAVYDQEAEVRAADGHFTEVLAPGVFDATLAAGADVRFLDEHDDRRLLGRTSARTLTLNSDRRGLWVQAELPDTTLGRDTAAMIRRGDVSGMSVGFVVEADAWTAPAGRAHRCISRGALIDVSTTSLPVYGGTTAEVRSLTIPTIPTPSGPNGHERNRRRLALAERTIT